MTMNDNQKEARGIKLSPLEALDKTTLEIEDAVEKLLNRNLKRAKLLNPHLSKDAHLILSIVGLRLETESSIPTEVAEKILSDIQEMANTIEEVKRGIQ